MPQVSVVNNEVIKHTQELRSEFEKVCKEANVYWGLGPSMAFFQTPGPGIKRYVYVAFGMKGVKLEGNPTSYHPDIEMVLQESVKVFRDWLQPNRTLVWRIPPEVDTNGEQWASYWRCVQLNDDAKQITIEWNL